MKRYLGSSQSKILVQFALLEGVILGLCMQTDQFKAVLHAICLRLLRIYNAFFCILNVIVDL